MRIDTYTKVVLTIIAACLVWICVSRLGTPLSAQGQAPQEVVLVGIRAERGMSLAVRPTDDWYRNPLPVDVTRTIGVRLLGVERAAAGRWDPVDVNVKEQPKKATPGN